MNCPACNKPLSKRYRRELSPFEWQKLQVADYMRTVQAQNDFINLLQRCLLKVTKERDELSKKKGRKCRS